jgi:V8-like Glu-specific endopeptidase
MKQILILLAFLASSCITNIFNTEPTATVTPDYSLAYRSVVLLYVSDTDGGKVVASGFAYDKDHIITAGHFCISALEIQIFKSHTENIGMKYYNDDMEIKIMQNIEILEMSRVQDLCMLKKENHGLVPLKIIEDYSKVKIRDNVTIVGAPSGIAIGEFYGKVMFLKYDGDIKVLKEMLVVSAAATGGVSGSPIILDKTGEVIGVLVRGHPYFDHLSFGTNGAKLKKFIDGLK